MNLTFFKPRNIQTKGFPALDWQNGQRGTSLANLRKYVIEESKQAIEWYSQKRPLKKFFARTLRGLAIVLSGFGGLIPLIGKWIETEETPSIDPILSGILIGVAGILIILDKFFGFTSAWIRYMKAEQRIGRVLKTFHFAYEEMSLGWISTEPTTEQAESCLLMCKSIVLQVDEIVRTETEQWVNEFQKTLQEIDVAVKDIAPQKPQGAISVIATNGDKCTNGWKLTIDGGTEHTCSGTETGLRGLTAGLHSISITGEIGNTIRKNTKIVEVKDGQISKVEFSL